MLEKPDLQDSLIIAGLQEAYNLPAARLVFLPLGADINTAVYRAEAQDGTAYFLKLRKGVFDETTVTIPLFLKAQGVQPVIAPLASRTGQHWADFGDYTMILYPFIAGANGWDVALSERQWREFGAALKGIHAVRLPPGLEAQLPCEDYSPRWRELVRTFQAQVKQDTFDEPAAARLAAFMQEKRAEIDQVVRRADELGETLQERSLERVLCHSDVHGGNLLLGADGALYIVDWDNPILAPKERDLMFIGGGVGEMGKSAREQALFYQGYGPAQVDRMALAYYRYERIVQDFAAFCQQLLLTTEGSEDREQGFYYFTTNFLPGGEIEIARQTDLEP